MGSDKRQAVSVASAQSTGGKNQKTNTTTTLNTPKATKPAPKPTKTNTVVPATPGTAVDPSGKRKQAQSPSKEARPDKRQKTVTQPASTQPAANQQPRQQSGKPGTLPLEPHAAILSDLESKYNVRALSVISSTKMEKRIDAVLSHLSGQPNTASTTTTATQGGQTPESATRPGIVLLHSRASDANKMISITEIVKQRIREGGGASAADAPKTKGKKGSKLSRTSWFQYNRIYDVVTTSEEAAEDDGDDDFAPMLHRFTEAMGDKKASQGHGKTTTYMSIILSRTPVVELQKKLEISVQASTDPLEIEYEKWMAST